jgi:peptide/nickel transport system substrate-binding protein
MRIKSKMNTWQRFLAFFFLLILAACADKQGEVGVTAVAPTPTTPAIQPTASLAPIADDDFLIIATDAPDPPFTNFDEFGEVIGFNDAIMENIAAIAHFQGYEFVVTPHEGVLESIANKTTDDFEAVMSVLVIPEEGLEGIAYTAPYLEIGQVMVVLADNTAVQSYRDLPPNAIVGVRRNSRGEEAARTVVGLPDDRIQLYDSSEDSLQALINEAVQAVILDNFNGRHFTDTFPEQLKLAGGSEQSAWISSKQFGIAVAADDTDLLQRLNEAIAQLQTNRVVERLSTAWLISDSGKINPGESRVGTAPSELVIGIVGDLPDMDPTTDPRLISWEVKNNTMSGLFMFDANNELQPMLALGQPAISEDKREYTIELREGLIFPDGTPFTANAVRESILRSARLGSFLVNGFLKDSNDDGFADEDAIQVIGQYTVKIVLQEPTSYFLELLAIPPYYPVSTNCYAATFDPTSICGGIGPYTIASRGEDEMRLKANPQWPGLPPAAFENIRLRFFADAAALQNALVNFRSVDVAWSGLSSAELTALQGMDGNADGIADFVSWHGPAIFKSYLMFDQATPPWDNKKVREAVALSVDREAIVDEVFAGSRLPLLSPVPDEVPGRIAVLPSRNLAQARALLLEVGYSESVPLDITLWFIADGRYSAVEDQYAAAIKAQLEETNVFRVTLQSAPWESYQAQIFSCGYNFYLMGWPSPGAPPNYLHITSWTDFFISGRGFCSNYDAEAMTTLATEAEAELDVAARTALYDELQRLWAEDLPTLDLTQEPRRAISVMGVDNVQMDAMGLMHYELLTKGN